MKRYFEFKDEKSNKFWEIIWEGAEQTVRFGKIGTEGQKKTKSFKDAHEAQAESETIIVEKLAKGYVEVLAGQTSTAPQLPANPPADQNLVEWMNSGELAVGPVGANLLVELAEKNNIRLLSQLLKIPPANLPSAGARDIQAGLKELGISWGKPVSAPKSPKGGVPKKVITFVADSTETAMDRFGGRPSHWEDAPWPTCAKCQSPMEFILQLTNIGDFAALQIFACARQECPAYAALKGSNAALLRKTISAETMTSPLESLPGHRMEATSGTDDKVLMKPDREPEEDDKYFEAMETAYGSKIGGVLVDQSANYPNCPGCQKRMTYFARFELPIVPTGLREEPIILYTCLPCGKSAFHQLPPG